MTEKGSVRVLLVDDHPLVRDGIRARLEATGHVVVVGEAAWVPRCAPSRRTACTCGASCVSMARPRW